MARFKDLKSVARGYGKWPLLKRLYAEINDDNVFTNAAAMAYAWIFAVFPFFIFLLSLAPYLPADRRTQGVAFLKTNLSEYVTPTAANTITANFESLINEPRGGLLSVGLLLTLFAASGGMNTTMSSLDQAFDVGKPRSYVVRRGVAMGLTIFMVVSVLIILLMLPVGSTVTNWLQAYSDKLPGGVRDLISGPSLVLLTVARYIIGLTVMQILIGVLYWLGPSGRRRLRFFTPGSVFTGLGWLATGFAMRVYVESYANFPKTYGAVAGMVVMLMIFYINAVILLIGAEIDSEVQTVRRELHEKAREKAGA
jgi:membrane protein